jgi:dihydrofolate reductase
MSVPVALIVAMGENRVIGANGKIPWRIPADFGFFRRMTLGKPLIIGRKTFDSLGKPLPGRTNIVVSRDRGFVPEGAIVARDLAEALAQGQAIAADTGADEVMVGGGAQIYAETISGANRLYVTHVALSPEGDAVFPVIDLKVWEVVATLEVPADPRDTAAFRVNVYEKRNPS